MTTLDQYFTQQKLAQRIVEWARIEPGSRVLEPEAGGGAFVDELLKVQDVRVTAVEIDKRHARKLSRKYDGHVLRDSTKGVRSRVEVVHTDFLTMKPREGKKLPFGCAVMNPPYGSRKNGTVGLAARHVAHALKFTPRVVALVASAFEHGTKNETNLFSFAQVTRRVVLISRPGFDGPDSNGEEPRRDYVVLELMRKPEIFSDYPITNLMVETERWAA